MHYIVDGYNLMFRILHAGGDLQTQREQVIRDLNEKIRLLHLDVTIVFDAKYQYGIGSRAHFGALEICFTDEGETADDYIIDVLKAAKNPGQETIITSDNKLAWRARRRLAKTETVEKFIAWLEKRYVNKIRLRKQERETQTPLIETSRRNTLEPPSEENIEGSFDYYLHAFEKRFQQITSKENPPKQKKPPSEKKESDVARWLRIFEEESNKKTD